jgi:hypothetical protein
MKRLVVLLATLALLASAPAAASTGSLPPYKLKPGMTLKQTLARVNRALNRASGFSDADCWLYNGTARMGWRHAACVGTYNAAGTTYRFKLTRTPISCSRERLVFVIPAVKREASTVNWTHVLLDCGPSSTAGASSESSARARTRPTGAGLGCAAPSNLVPT